MAPFGKIYSYPDSTRSYTLFYIAHANGLDIETVLTNPYEGVSDQYIQNIQPLGKVPAFVGNDGTKLHECMAIAFYLIPVLKTMWRRDTLNFKPIMLNFAKQDPKTKLLGSSVVEEAEVLQWMSYSNQEVIPSLRSWYGPIIGRDLYNKKNVDAAEIQISKILSALEKLLLDRTYLVGERLTLADLFLTSSLTKGFLYLFDLEYKKKYPNVFRFWDLIRNQKSFVAVAGQPKYIEQRAQYQPAKKEEKPKKENKPKAEPTPTAEKKPAAEEEDEDDVPREKAPKHPLALLAPPKLAIDEWKRFYSNNDPDVALKWFWEHYDESDYTLWKVDYKYNDELELIFQTSNLISGLFNRLSASTKYLFGCMVVLGKDHDNSITGAFLVRGDKYEQAFDVAPDWDSYDYKRLSAGSEDDKRFLQDVWSWDKPIDGKDVAAGKVFK